MTLQVSSKGEVHGWTGNSSCATGDPTLMLTAAMENIGLLDLQRHLANSGKGLSLSNFSAMPIPVPAEPAIQGPGGEPAMLQAERYRNTTELAAKAAASLQSMNPDQLELYNVIMESVLRQDRAAVVILPPLYSHRLSKTQTKYTEDEKRDHGSRVDNPTFY
jgi:hypothetical protein